MCYNIITNFFERVLKMCNITIEDLRKRLTACKTLEDYQALIDACVYSIHSFPSVPDRKAVYGILEACAASCREFLMNPKERAVRETGWDDK